MAFCKDIIEIFISDRLDECDLVYGYSYRAFGNTTLNVVALTGVEDAYAKNSGDSDSKGVKAHFRMDDSGLIHLDKVSFAVVM